MIPRYSEIPRTLGFETTLLSVMPLRDFRNEVVEPFSPPNLELRGRKVPEKHHPCASWAGPRSWTYKQLLVWFNCCLGYLPWPKKSHFHNLHLCFVFHKTLLVIACSRAIVKEEAYILMYLILKCHWETFKCWHLDEILLQWCFISELKKNSHLCHNSDPCRDNYHFSS